MDNATLARKAVVERGLTYRDIANEIGITPQAVYAIVQGIATGTTGRYAVAKALGVEVKDLWPDPDEVTAKAA